MIRQREPLFQGCEWFKDVAYVRRQLLGNVLASVGLGAAMRTDAPCAAPFTTASVSLGQH